MADSLPSPPRTPLNALGFSAVNRPKNYVDLPTRLKHIRARLVDSGTYLGKDDACSNLTWTRIGGVRKVTLTPAAAAAATLTDDTDNDAAPPEPPMSSSPSELEASPEGSLTSSKQSQDTPQHSDSPPANKSDDLEAAELSEPIAEPAVLSAVVYISQDDFYMSSDGNYQGPGRYFQNLAKVKLSCMCEAPDAHPFKDDYANVAKNARLLIAAALTPGFKNKRGFVAGIEQTTRLKMRHVLFEPLGGDLAEPEYDENLSFTSIKYWPVRSEAASSELEGMVETHRVVPLPAYDMHGHLIHPHFYRSRLAGSIAEVHFELNHWSMKASQTKNEPACDTFAADVIAIRVLVPPKPTVVTPRKRKVAHKMDPMDSPTPPRKKARRV